MKHASFSQTHGERFGYLCGGLILVITIN